MRKLALPIIAVAALGLSTVAACDAFASIPVGPGSSLGVCSVAATGYVDGRSVALTAGHCTLGLFGEIHLPDTDWALIPIPPGFAPHNVLPDGDVLTKTGEGAVCRWGQVSQTRCDGYVNIAPSDSGGPVYYSNGDGTATLTGVTSSNTHYSTLPPGFTLTP